MKNIGIIAIVLATCILSACQNIPAALPEAEVEREFTQRAELAELQRRLEADFADVYAGLYVMGGDVFSPTVLMTEIDNERLNAAKFTTDFHVEKADYSLARLERTKTDLINQLQALGLERFGVGVDIRANRVDVNVPDLATFRSLAGRESLTFGDEVRFFEGVMELTSTRRAGDALENPPVGGFIDVCTAGFNVVSTAGVRGMTTAGHCANNMHYKNLDHTTVPVIAEMNAGNVDIQWGYRSDDTYSNTSFYSPGITSALSHAQQFAGDEVCKYGVTTKYDCGILMQTDWTDVHNGVTADFLLVENTKKEMADKGDSGWPVFRGSIALGMIHAKLPKDKANGHPCERLLYIPTDSFSVLGLTILTTP